MKDIKKKYGIIHERNAEVKEHVETMKGESSWSFIPGYTVVKDETGAIHHLSKSDLPVGSKCIIQYITTPSSGLWYLKKLDS